MKNLMLGTAALCMLSFGAHAAGPQKTINFCTGPQGGNYEFSGIEIKGQASGSIKVNTMTTKGSIENLERIDDGSCDVAIVQSDAHGVYMAQHPTSKLNIERGRVLYPEYVHLICGKDSGLGKITGLKKGMTVLVGPNGGGSQVTWDSFKMADPNRYGEIATKPIGGKRALGMVDDGRDATCFFYVTGLASSGMKEADDFAEKSGKLILVATDDSDVAKLKDAKGGLVYGQTSIPSGTYPKAFQTRSLTGSSVGAITVSAIVVGSIPFIDANEDVYDKFLRAMNNAMPAILEHVQGGRK